MPPDTPARPFDRAIDRLDAVCREIAAPLAGALPVLILVGVLFFGSPAIPKGSAVSHASCDYSRAAGTQTAGPRSHDLLCIGRSLQGVAEVGAGAGPGAGTEGGR